jgi:predicted metal-dependent HD superfamily phosphohydrolase
MLKLAQSRPAGPSHCQVCIQTRDEVAKVVHNTTSIGIDNIRALAVISANHQGSKYDDGDRELVMDLSLLIHESNMNKYPEYCMQFNISLAN